ncbi:MAG TPA: hypothetical protein VN814_10060 [Caulobacteraceae bacterium]|nr:hypothetical protein [Caulobacteraceae bacterium]
MSSLRLLAASIALGGSLGAALLAAIGLAGARDNWADVANSFVPFILVVAVVAAGLAVWSLDQGGLRFLVLTLSTLAFVYAGGVTGVELSKLSLPRSRGETFHLLTANVWEQNPTPALAADEILARRQGIKIVTHPGADAHGTGAARRHPDQHAVDAQRADFREFERTEHEVVVGAQSRNRPRWGR